LGEDVVKTVSARTVHWNKKYWFAALAAPFLVMGQAAQAQFDNGPLEMAGGATEELVPGRTIDEGNPIFNDGQTSFFAMPGDRVQFLYHASQGENLSGRSSNIQNAFASASADDNLNGGVGATSWVGANPSDTDPTAVQRLTAIPEWERHISFTGNTPQVGFMEVAIPALEVGLINVVSEAR